MFKFNRNYYPINTWLYFYVDIPFNVWPVPLIEPTTPENTFQIDTNKDVLISTIAPIKKYDNVKLGTHWRWASPENGFRCIGCFYNPQSVEIVQFQDIEEFITSRST